MERVERHSGGFGVPGLQVGQTGGQKIRPVGQEELFVADTQKARHQREDLLQAQNNQNGFTIL